MKRVIEIDDDVYEVDKITRDQWVKYVWLDVTIYGDKHRMMLRGWERTPQEGAEAADQWDIWHSAIEASKP